MYTLDDFHQALTAPHGPQMQLELGGNHLRYLILLILYTNASPYRGCMCIAGIVCRTRVVFLFTTDLIILIVAIQFKYTILHVPWQSAQVFTNPIWLLG